MIAAYILKRPYMAASSSSAPLKKSKDSSEEDEEKSALELLLDDGNFDLLRALLAALAPREAARLSQISREWATAAEDCLQAACHSYRWQLPRRQRLQHRYSLPDVPWRGVFIARVCRGCHAAAGDFAVKDTGAGAPKCFLCGKCAKEPSVVERLQRSNLTLDVTGLSGKPLFTRRESKFCSDVSRLSKEAIDNANGAKADRIARGRR